MTRARPDRSRTGPRTCCGCESAGTGGPTRSMTTWFRSAHSAKDSRRLIRTIQQLLLEGQVATLSKRLTVAFRSDVWIESATGPSAVITVDAAWRVRDRGLRGARCEYLVVPIRAPCDMRLAFPDSGPEVEGGASIRRPGQLPDIVTSLDPRTSARHRPSVMLASRKARSSSRMLKTFRARHEPRPHKPLT
jgi:hypothetical protein